MDVLEAIRAPAVLVFRERGRLLFANPAARFLLSYSSIEMEDLQGWCARLFPGEMDSDRAASTLRRALSDEGLPTGESFRAVFLTRDCHEREGLFQVISWRERDGEVRAMLSCVSHADPGSASHLPSRQGVPLGSMTDLVERIRELLEVAVTVGQVGFSDGNGAGDPQDLLQRLLAAQGLLTGVELGT